MYLLSKNSPINNHSIEHILHFKITVTISTQNNDCSQKASAPPPPVTDQALLRSYFDRVDKNSNGFICAKEFQSALTNEIEDFPLQIETVT